ncbi:MAG: hypothetical protein M1442_00715 [Candidatus Thermoplasmatota archaeon]|nr:hypothetical protein [Candidatus Thermoplasmatota archaeon]
MMDVTREEVKRIVDFLRENPDVAREFSVVVSAGIVERIDSFEKVMERHFEESSARFEALDAKFNAIIKEMHEGFEEARKEREAGFAAANRRFEEHDRKFDAIIKEMHEGFEEARKEREAGFAAANRRFEEHDRKFDEIIKRMDETTASFNKKFEEHDRKFDEIIKRMDETTASFNKKFEEHDRKFDAIIKEMHEGFAVASKERSSLGNTLGRIIEDRVRDKIEFYAENIGWKSKTRVVSHDEEIDILVRDGVSFFVEAKSHADMDALKQVVRKSKKLRLPGVLVGDRLDRGVVVEAKRLKILCLTLFEFRKALQTGRIERLYSSQHTHTNK